MTKIRLGDLEVHRIGYGAMGLAGDRVMGEPDDPAGAREVLRRAVDLGIDFIDTAWYYGPYVTNRLVAEALHPYPRGLVIATKLGTRRTSDGKWIPALRPEELRKDLEHDLRTLRLERLDVVHLRNHLTSDVPLMESVDALVAMQAEGTIRHIGLSNVNARQIARVIARTPIVTVQNFFNVSGGVSELARQRHVVVDDPEGVLALCTKKKIAFVPFGPLAVGKIGKEKPVLAKVAKDHDVSAAQVALAWLLARSPMMLPIPGTTSLEHLEENWASRLITLSSEELASIAR